MPRPLSSIEGLHERRRSVTPCALQTGRCDEFDLGANWAASNVSDVIRKLPRRQQVGRRGIQGGAPRVPTAPDEEEKALKFHRAIFLPMFAESIISFVAAITFSIAFLNGSIEIGRRSGSRAVGLARVVASTICFPAADFVDPPSYYCWYFPTRGIISYGNVDELSAPHLFGFFPSFFFLRRPRSL